MLSVPGTPVSLEVGAALAREGRGEPRRSHAVKPSRGHAVVVAVALFGCRAESTTQDTPPSGPKPLPTPALSAAEVVTPPPEATAPAAARAGQVDASAAEPRHDAYVNAFVSVDTQGHNDTPGQALDRATVVASIATDTRHLVLMGGEEDPMPPREVFRNRALLRTGPPLAVITRDWLAPRPVGYSDDCLFDSLYPLDWSKQYVYYSVTDFEGEGGLVKLLGMSFDDHVERGDRRWYLVAIAVWGEWPPDEAR